MDGDHLALEMGRELADRDADVGELALDLVAIGLALIGLVEVEERAVPGRDLDGLVAVDPSPIGRCPASVLCGGVSRANCARNKPGPLMVRIALLPVLADARLAPGIFHFGDFGQDFSFVNSARAPGCRPARLFVDPTRAFRQAALTISQNGHEFQNLTSDRIVQTGDRCKAEEAACRGESSSSPGRPRASASPSPSAAARAGATGSCIVGRDAEKGAAAAAAVARTRGATAAFVAADLAEPSAPDAIFEAALERFGHVDALVNAAGLTDRGAARRRRPRALGAALRGQCARAVLSHADASSIICASAARRASIVNILSMHAHGGAPRAGGLRLDQGGAGGADHATPRTRIASTASASTASMSAGSTRPAERQMQAVTLGKGEAWLAEAAAQQPFGRLLDARRRRTARALSRSPTPPEPMTGAVIDQEQFVIGAWVEGVMDARLSEPSRRTCRRSVRRPDTIASALAIGMAHIGVGAFHRCHQAEFTDDMLEARFGHWGIVGVNLAPPRLDATARAAGRPLLAHAVARATAPKPRIVGAISGSSTSRTRRARKRRVAALASPRHQGRHDDGDREGLLPDPRRPARSISSNPALSADLEGASPPRTLLGLLALALERRRRIGATGLTLISCDNIPSNGARLARGAARVRGARSAELARWIEREVAFPCDDGRSDRPGDDAGRHRCGLRRARRATRPPVVGEPFRQWVIEDRFAGERPPWDLAGAQFVADAEALRDRSRCACSTPRNRRSRIRARWSATSSASGGRRSGARARSTRRMLERRPRATLPEVAGMEVAALYRSRRSRASATPRSVIAATRSATDGSQKIVQRLARSAARATGRRAEPARSAHPRGRELDRLCLQRRARFGARWAPSDPFARDHHRDRATRRGLATRTRRSGALAMRAIFGADLARPRDRSSRSPPICAAFSAATPAPISRDVSPMTSACDGSIATSRCRRTPTSARRSAIRRREATRNCARCCRPAPRGSRRSCARSPIISGSIRPPSRSGTVTSVAGRPASSPRRWCGSRRRSAIPASPICRRYSSRIWPTRDRGRIVAESASARRSGAPAHGLHRLVRGVARSAFASGSTSSNSRRWRDACRRRDHLSPRLEARVFARQLRLARARQSRRSATLRSTTSARRVRDCCAPRRRRTLCSPISFTPYNSNTPELATSAAQRGVPVVSLTDSAFSPLVPISKAYVEVVEESFSGFKSLSATLAVAMALVLRVEQRRSEAAARNSATVKIGLRIGKGL